jgi:hypothetical protein
MGEPYYQYCAHKNTTYFKQNSVYDRVHVHLRMRAYLCVGARMDVPSVRV